jgi:hypothetical protein
MKSILYKKYLKWGTKAFFLIAGVASLIWFLVRVIPKPSRAAYPCMKAAFPLASSLIVYLIGITSFTLLMRKAKERLLKAKYLISASLAIAGLVVGVAAMISYNVKLKANPLSNFQIPNEVRGEGVGIFPGRVVWQYNPAATEKGCTNTVGDYWYQATDLEVVNEMLSEGLQLMTGTENDEAAWEAVFKYFNNKNGKGDIGYSEGEEIVIKTNNNAIWNGDNCINTSPQITYAILDQLVNHAGVAQDDISIGDPNCAMPAYTYDFCKGDFPNVKYWGENADTRKVDNVFYTSDGNVIDPLPLAYLDASYMINIPVFKKHHRAGVSLCSKNHFGSFAPYTSGAWHLHPSLPCPEASGIAENGDYGEYRCFVDIMGHKDLGGKTILYLVDGLWGSTNWGHPPVKFEMKPFNFDWPSSLFLSQDPVAIESVCFDFLYEEFDDDHPTEGGRATEDKGPFPHFAGTDDFLRQAADPSLRPFDYDPEDDGSVLGSMGVNEHWNNPEDKSYSRNLGNSEGIELLNPLVGTSIDDDLFLESLSNELMNYPNPFTESTRIKYQMRNPGKVYYDIYNVAGQKVFSYTEKHASPGCYEFVWTGKDNSGHQIPEGEYFLNLRMEGKSGIENISLKMMLVK